MSESTVVQIKCPRCHYDSPMTQWRSINRDLDPKLAEDFLSEKLYDWKCEVCGLEASVPYDTIFHDMTHRFMAFFSPYDHEKDKYEDVPIPVQLWPGTEDYKFRLVLGMNNLKEKLAIFDCGLDDVVIERMKYFLKLSGVQGLRPEDKVYFLEVDTDPEKIQKSGWERGAIVFVKVPDDPKKEQEAIAVKMEMYYDYQLAVQTDPRMKAPRCTCIDQGWIDLQLKKL